MDLMPAIKRIEMYDKLTSYFWGEGKMSGKHLDELFEGINKLATRVSELEAIMEWLSRRRHSVLSVISGGESWWLFGSNRRKHKKFEDAVRAGMEMDRRR